MDNLKLAQAVVRMYEMLEEVAIHVPCIGMYAEDCIGCNVCDILLKDKELYNNCKKLVEDENEG